MFWRDRGEGEGEGEGEEDYNPREDLVFVLIILTRMFTHRVTLVKIFHSPHFN